MGLLQVNLPIGTNEILYIGISDKLDTIETLDPYTITYELFNDDADRDADPATTEVVASGTASNNGMTVAVGPINTTGYEEGEYSLFINIALPPQTIRLGPFRVAIG